MLGDLGVYCFCGLHSGTRFEPSSCLCGSKLQDITPMTFKSYEMIQSEGFSQAVLFRLFFTFLARQHISTVI